MLTPEKIEALRRRSVHSAMPFFIRSLRTAEAKGYAKFLPLEFVEDRCTMERVESSPAYAEVIKLLRANKTVPFTLDGEDGRCWLAIRRPDFPEPMGAHTEPHLKARYAFRRVVILALLIALGVGGLSFFLNPSIDPTPSRTEQRE